MTPDSGIKPGAGTGHGDASYSRTIILGTIRLSACPETCSSRSRIMCGEATKNPQGEVHEGSAALVSSAKIEAAGQFQMRLSVQHLAAAAHFSRRVGQIEQQYAGQPF